VAEAEEMSEPPPQAALHFSSILLAELSRRGTLDNARREAKAIFDARVCRFRKISLSFAAAAAAATPTTHLRYRQ